MIGPKQPDTLEIDAWQAHIELLQSHDDYPGRERSINAAEQMLSFITDAVEQTGQPPSALDAVRQFAPTPPSTP